MMMNMLMIPGSVISENCSSDVMIRTLYGGGKYFISAGTKEFTFNHVSQNEREGILDTLRHVLEKLQESS